MTLATATVGGWIQSADNHKATGFDLYNNDPAGGSLWLWAITVGNNGEGIYTTAQVAGHGANFAANATPIVTANALIPGVLYYDFYPAIDAGISLPSNTLFTGALAFEQELDVTGLWQFPGPLAVIGMGNSYRVQDHMANYSSPQGGGMLAVNFYYSWIPAVQ